MSSVPRHSEEELRQQWAFLDALVDRQAASLKSGVQDPEEGEIGVGLVAAESPYLEEISILTRRVTTLESERATLLRRIDLAEEARMAAEAARADAAAAREAAEQALADERARPERTPTRVTPSAPAPVLIAPPAPVAPSGTAAGEVSTPQVRTVPPVAAPAKPRRRSWWRRIRG